MTIIKIFQALSSIPEIGWGGLNATIIKIFQALWNVILVQYGEFYGLCSAGYCLSREVTFMCEHEKIKCAFVAILNKKL